MFWLLLVLSLLVALLLELQLPLVLWPGLAGQIPAVSAVVLYYVLTQHVAVGFVAVLLGGILVDGFSLVPPGAMLLVYTVALYLSDRYRQYLVPDATLTGLVFGAGTGALGVLVQACMAWQAGTLHSRVFPFIWRMGTALLMGGVVTAAGCALLQQLHAALDLTNQEKEDRHVNS